MTTLAVTVIVFGVHSAIDWTWFVPANALPAMICAGWVASRPTLRERFEVPPPGARRGRDPLRRNARRTRARRPRARVRRSGARWRP